MKNSSRSGSIIKKLFKGIALALGILFLLLSVLPYLIPLQSLEENRYEITYADSEFAEISGIELHYRKWDGSSDNEANVLLVHGLGGSTFTWRYTAPFLQEQGYRVIAVDLPGFGLSERKIGFDHSPEVRAQLLWSFINIIDPEVRWNLIGHSMGGATVSAMALQYPERVESLTLAAGALARFEPSLLTSLLKYPPVSRWFRVLGARLLLNEGRVEQFLFSAYGRNPEPEEITGYYLPLTVAGTDVVLVDLINSAPAPLLHRVGYLSMPVLCIWGENDTWVPLEHGLELSRLIDDAELVVFPEEGHCPMETAPDIFNEELVRFLGER